MQKSSRKQFIQYLTPKLETPKSSAIWAEFTIRSFKSFFVLMQPDLYSQSKHIFVKNVKFSLALLTATFILKSLTKILICIDFEPARSSAMMKFSNFLYVEFFNPILSCPVKYVSKKSLICQLWRTCTVISRSRTLFGVKFFDFKTNFKSTKKS